MGRQPHGEWIAFNPGAKETASQNNNTWMENGQNNTCYLQDGEKKGRWRKEDAKTRDAVLVFSFIIP